MRHERSAPGQDTRSDKARSYAPVASTQTPHGSPRAQQAYYHAFLAALVICFSPFKALAYAAPLLVTALMFMSGAVGRRRLIIAILVLVGLAAFYRLMADEFLLGPYVLAVVTHSSLLPVVLVDGRLIASRDLVHRIAAAATWVLLVEGLLGITQAIYGFTQTGSFGGANGDYVEGTIHPSLSAELAFGNPMFATNVVFLLLACMAHPTLALSRWPFLAAGLLALVLASVVHVLVFMVAATLLAALVVYSRRARRRVSRQGGRALIVIALAVAIASYVTFDTTISRITTYAETALDTTDLETEATAMPRSVMLYQLFTDVPGRAPMQPWLGLGPGQFCSRASLMASGLYLGNPDQPKPVPFIPSEVTSLAVEYCVDLHLWVSELEGIGSTHQPFFSLLTVYTELGLLGLLIVAIVFLRFVAIIRRRGLEEPERRHVLLIIATGGLFLMLLGLQQTYWEIPQAILVGCLILKALYAVTMHGDDRMASKSACGTIPSKSWKTGESR